MLNYRLVIAAGCVVIGLIFYIFYWNRIIGHLVSLLIRLVAWNQKESSVWVHIGASCQGELRLDANSKYLIGSIHFSLLGGRVSFKDFRYHSSNQTIHVVKGQISWRYWIRVPADEDDLSDARVVGETVGGTHSLIVTLPARDVVLFIIRKVAKTSSLMSRTHILPRSRMVHLQPYSSL